MKEVLISTLVSASGLTPEVVAKALVRPQDADHGDSAFPCFPLAKTWKIAPPQCAEKLKSDLTLPKEFSKVEVVGPYLNFFIDKGSLGKDIVKRILGEGFDVGKESHPERTMIVEYSAPNIAKSLHVGHMRTTLIGLSLHRVLKHLGFNVVAINHLGDWGTQFGFVWAGCELWGKPTTADLDGLVDIYVRATELRKAQDEGKVPPEDADKPNVNEMARDYFIRLEAGDRDAVAFWQWCLDISLVYLKEAYDRLGIEFDHYTGESFYRDKLEDVENKVRASGILEESKGALGVDLGKELGFARVFAEDGRSLYITRDIAAADYRETTFKPEKILYVVAAQQSLHFKQLVEILRRMKHPVAEKIEHVSFGFVPGMKTRGGSAISLKDFLNEAHDKALSAYREEVEKRPEGLNEEEVAESVAIGATYFYFLNHTNAKDFQFSWREALNFQGDTGAYVQYALARLYGLEAKAKESEIIFSPEGFNMDLLNEEEAHELVGVLARFSETIWKTATDYEPSRITGYALELARALSKAYRVLRVVGEDKAVAESRLALFIACRYVLRNALMLTGVPPVERM